jgi:hypothetical protein
MVSGVRVVGERTLASAPTGEVDGERGEGGGGNALWRVRLRGGFEAEGTVFDLPCDDLGYLIAVELVLYRGRFAGMDGGCPNPHRPK